MKVALVHDYIKEYGGAERVLESLHKIFPDAPVYTSVYLPQYLGPHRERFKDWDIRTSLAQNLPFKAKLISPLRLLSPWLFKRFDFSKFDVVIVSATGAYFSNSIRTKTGPHPDPLLKGEGGQGSGAVHICYCHTPPRYLYGYATAREWKKNRLLNILGEAANHFLRMVDFNSSKDVDQYIANSEEVKRRIEKFYRKEAEVIFPPVILSSRTNVRDPKRFLASTRNDKNPFFVAGGRLARPKHIDLIIRACQELDVPLKVFGKAFAGYGEELEALVKDKQENRHSGKRGRSASRISSAEPIVRDPGPNSAPQGRFTKASLGKQARMTNTRIELLGEVTDEEKWELLSGAKAYLFASEDEDFGLLPVEAMAAGIPVIAYRSGGVQETVIEGKTGLFFEELTVGGLKKTIREFEKKKFDSSVIRKRAEEFSEKTFQEKIKKLVSSKTIL